MPCYSLFITIASDEAWPLLEEGGIEVLYALEEDLQVELVIKTVLTKMTILDKFPFVSSCKPIELPEIDWASIWKEHAPGFSEGFLHLDLTPFGGDKTLLLSPGAGFGDLSHPTTCLVLELMQNEVKDQRVVDIGSGSGVLSIAAAALLAKEVSGIEIDRDAISHAQRNATLNQFENILFQTPEERQKHATPQSSVVLMNMIRSEQKIAWQAFCNEGPSYGIVLSSGILVEEEPIYLELIQTWGWKVEKRLERDGWLAFKAQF